MSDLQRLEAAVEAIKDEIGQLLVTSSATERQIVIATLRSASDVLVGLETLGFLKGNGASSLAAKERPLPADDDQ